jgi:hypothetical protein
LGVKRTCLFALQMSAFDPDIRLFNVRCGAALTKELAGIIRS